MQLARQMFSSPTKAFAALKERPVFALPMWLMLLGTVAVTGWYYGIVDIAWLQDQQMAAANVPAAQREAIANVPRAVFLLSATIAAPIVIVVIVSIGALYFMLAGAITNVRYSFLHWFAFNWWGASPAIIAFIPSLLILSTASTTEIPVSALQPLSANELLFHLEPGEKGYNFLTNIGLVQIVSVVLTVIGVRVWSGRSMLFSMVFGLLPTVLIYGVWAFFAFR
jgi:hypothetical protein